MKTFWICGQHSVNESIKNNKRKVIEVICKKNSSTENLCIYHKIKYRYYQTKDENKILQNNLQIAHQNTFANIESFLNLDLKHIPESKKANLIALENITDVRNIGSIIRTALCFSIKGVVVEKKNFKSDSIEMYKTASGALEYISIYAVSNLNQALTYLKKKNYFIYGMDSNEGEEFDEKTISKNGNIFVMGSEGFGLKELTKKNSDFLIKINMSGQIGSLNVANACSVALGIFNYITNKKKAR